MDRVSYVSRLSHSSILAISCSGVEIGGNEEANKAKGSGITNGYDERWHRAQASGGAVGTGHEHGTVSVV